MARANRYGSPGVTSDATMAVTSAVAATGPNKAGFVDMLALPSGPHGRRNRMVGFLFRLETRDGLPAEPPTLSAAVPNWSPGDVIALGAGRVLQVVAVRDVEADARPVLVVEDAA
jgi:hypothetical protein